MNTATVSQHETNSYPLFETEEWKDAHMAALKEWSGVPWPFFQRASARFAQTKNNTPAVRAVLRTPCGPLLCMMYVLAVSTEDPETRDMSVDGWLAVVISMYRTRVGRWPWEGAPVTRDWLLGSAGAWINAQTCAEDLAEELARLEGLRLPVDSVGSRLGRYPTDDAAFAEGMARFQAGELTLEGWS